MDKLKTFKYFYVDDFVSKEIQNELESSLLTDEIPYFYNHSTTSKEYMGDNGLVDSDFGDRIFEKEHFTHTFVNRGKRWSDKTDILRPLIKQLPEKDELYRVKVNLLLQDKNGDPDCHNTPHHDFTDFSYYIGLYYVCDSDGDTFLFDEDKKIMDRITPKKGRMVFMRGDVLHASRHPIKFERRLAINLDIMPND